MAVLNDEIRQPEERNRIVVKEGSNIKIVPVHDVQYIEAYDDYVKIFTQKEMFLKKKTMSFYEQTLNPSQFVRVHRSYILSLQQLTKIEQAEIPPLNELRILVMRAMEQQRPAERSWMRKLF